MNILKILILLFWGGCSSMPYTTENISIIFSSEKEDIMELNTSDISNFYIEKDRITLLEITKKTFLSIREHEKKIRYISIMDKEHEVYKSKWMQPSGNILSVSRSAMYYSKEKQKIAISLNSCRDNNASGSTDNCSVDITKNEELIKKIRLLNKLKPADSLSIREFKRITWLHGLPEELKN